MSTTKSIKPAVGGRSSLQGVLSRFARDTGWALGIGAGTSVGLFPDWNALAKDLVRKAGYGFTEGEMDSFIKAFGPSALMQTVYNLSPDIRPTIPDKLSDTLYFGLRQRSGKTWTTIAKALTASKPSALTVEKWEQFAQVVTSDGRASAPAIARIIAGLDDESKRPDAVFSFNAEPLLPALVNCYHALKHGVANKDIRIIERLSHNLAARRRGRLPFYFVHGLLPIAGRDRFNQFLAPDKLIFTESQYLNLARSSYSWQSDVFLNACIQYRFVFIGLSFTDPNLRRWLGWEWEGRETQWHRKRNAGLHVDSPDDPRSSHYWLRTRPGNGEDTRLIEKSVEHFGVRIVWLDSWSDVEPTLRLMLE